MVLLMVAIPILRYAAERWATEKATALAGTLGVEMRLDSLDLGLTGSARIRGLELARQGQPLLRCDRVEVSLALRTLRPERLWLVGCRGVLRLREDVPVDVVALRQAWDRRAKKPREASGGGGRGEPSVIVDAGELAVDAVGGQAARLHEARVLVDAVHGNRNGLQGKIAFLGPVGGSGRFVLTRDGDDLRAEVDGGEGGLVVRAAPAGLQRLSVGAVTLHDNADARDVEAHRVVVARDGIQLAIDRAVARGSGPTIALYGLRAVLPGSSATPPGSRLARLYERARGLGLPTEASVTVTADAVSTEDLSRLLAGALQLRADGLGLRGAGFRASVGSLAIARDGAALFGPRGPMRLQLRRPALQLELEDPGLDALARRLAEQTPNWLRARFGALQQRLGRVAQRGPTGASVRPQSANRPLWQSNPEKMPPATARFAPAAAALTARMDAALRRAVGLREQLGRVDWRVDVRGGRLAIRGGSHTAAASFDLGLEPRAKGRDGRLLVDVAMALDGRAAGRLSSALVLPLAGTPLEVALHFDGAELARAASALVPRIALGAAPRLAVDVWLTAAPGAGGSARFAIDASDVGVDWWRVSARPLRDFAIQARGEARFGGPKTPLELALAELRVGSSTATDRLVAAGWARLHGVKRPSIDLSAWLPEQDCGVALGALPESLLPTVGRVRARGRLSGWADLHLDIAHPWYSEIDLGWDDARCTLLDAGKLDVDALAEPFRRPANEDGKLRADQPIGPQSGSWVAIGAMPRWLSYAMVTTEDGSFWQHRGLNTFLLNRAIRLDLHVGRFVYGGSTITQQLAKNLFFRRDKTLLRKLEEAIATWLMERRLGKPRILEIYCNAVEMAPDHYGVVRGAALYFGKRPEQLGPVEAAWLGILKPCPRCAYRHFKARAIPGWYQKRLLEILTRMWRNGMIDDARFAEVRNRPPAFVDWPPEKLAVRWDWPVPEKKEPEPRRLDRGR
ncbi:MAG: transglycosylase domain-containing protein [Deltaproteobacteria bacterium]|nr:transglycosylase domain-containing protein [Deltaproteobacteria bacterium]